MREHNYLRDVFFILLERAREAGSLARKSEASGSELDAMFQDGRAQGYYEVLSMMTNQLGAFEIPREVVGLSEDFDVERELL